MDAFAVFEEKRLPYLDREILKKKFLAFTEENHPDKFRNSQKYREIERAFSQKHEAYRILLEPKWRLAHLLELEFNFRPDEVKAMPKEVMELGWKLTEICTEVDQLKGKEDSLTSSLAKALFMKEKMVLLPKLRDLKYAIADKVKHLEEEGQLLNESWKKGSKNKEALLALYYSTSFVTRWSQQIDERLAWLIV